MNIIVNGALGHMGRIVTNKIHEALDMEIAALVDTGANPNDTAIYPSLSDIPDEIIESSKPSGLVIIDFSNAAATSELMTYAVANGIPVLIATTGQSPEDKALIKESATSIPVFYSGNMSLGVALMADLVRQVVSTFPTADIEIVETHHTRKVDAPSGTALLLADAAKEGRQGLSVNVGRSGMCKRENDEIGISSVRRGNIVGIHEVIISTESESITLKHEAHDRSLFADGALTAAKFLASQGAGLYDMKSIFNG